MEISAIRNSIGRRIKDLRKERGLSQEQFALMAGINRSYLAGIERGNRNFGVNTLGRIVDGFGISFEEFFRGM